MDVLTTIGGGFKDAFLMAWEVWWALVLGFAISAIVQAWVPRERIERALGGSGARPVAVATALGAASSSCSYAAIAIAKSLFQKGASAASALAFQFASTILGIELGIVMWVLIGWQFTLAELVGGLILIVVMTVLLRLFVSKRLEEHAREHAQEADTGHQHHMAGKHMSVRERLTSMSAWSDVAHNFRNDWGMLYREITIGFLLAGFIGQLHNGFFNALFSSHAPAGVKLIENALIGPIIAVLSFVCSVADRAHEAEDGDDRSDERVLDQLHTCRRVGDEEGVEEAVVKLPDEPGEQEADRDLPVEHPPVIAEVVRHIRPRRHRGQALTDAHVLAGHVVLVAGVGLLGVLTRVLLEAL